jgi:hypothetical protein
MAGRLASGRLAGRLFGPCHDDGWAASEGGAG